jgi:hypothetical protein
VLYFKSSSVLDPTSRGNLGYHGTEENMGKIVAYLRASTDKQDIQNQKYEILDYANRRGMKIDEWMGITIS